MPIKLYNHILLILFLSSFITLNVNAQENTGSNNKQDQKKLSPYELQERVYFTALNYSDYDAARQALYQMISLKPQKVSLYDSLAYVYYQQGSYSNCLLVSRDILKGNPEKTGIRRIKAISEQQLGLLKDALSDYQKLYKESQNLYQLYEIASIQYRLQKVDECRNNLDEIINDAEAEDKKINISISRNKQQKVPLKAAALNMKGVLAMDLKENKAAKKYFNNALEVSPDFQLPKGNLEAMKKEDKKIKKGEAK